MPAQTFHIHHHPTDFTRRLLASQPGSIVTFTLEELVQRTVHHRKGSGTSRKICTGILAVYQMAAQHLDPSVAAQIALRAIQHRELYCGIECSGCTWDANEMKLCLRADLESYPELPISCSTCVAEGKECNVITRHIPIRDPIEWDWDEHEPYDRYPEPGSQPKKKKRPVLEVPEVLRLAPTHTLKDIDEYFAKNPWGMAEGPTFSSWNDLFKGFEAGSGSGLGYYEDEGEFGRRWSGNAETRERWVRELFGHFPGVIKEVEDVGSKLEVDSDADEAQVEAQLQEGFQAKGDTALKGLATTWSIVVPAYISSAPFPLDQASQPRLDLPYECPPDSSPPSPEAKSHSGSLGGPPGKGAGKKTAAAKKQTQGKAGGSGGHAGGGGIKGGGGVKAGNAQAPANGKGKKDKGKGGRGAAGGVKKGKGRQSDNEWPKRET